jgi:hypothetical protein
MGDRGHHPDELAFSDVSALVEMLGAGETITRPAGRR